MIIERSTTHFILIRESELYKLLRTTHRILHGSQFEFEGNKQNTLDRTERDKLEPTVLLLSLLTQMTHREELSSVM